MTEAGADNDFSCSNSAGRLSKTCVDATSKSPMRPDMCKASLQILVS